MQPNLSLCKAELRGQSDHADADKKSIQKLAEAKGKEVVKDLAKWVENPRNQADDKLLGLFGKNGAASIIADMHRGVNVPKIVLLDAKDMNGALGAYSSANGGVIYLSKSLFGEGSSVELLKQIWTLNPCT